MIDAQLRAGNAHLAAGRHLAAHQPALDEAALELQLLRCGQRVPEASTIAATSRPMRISCRSPELAMPS